MAFPDAWMRELLSRNDIVSVIGEYTRLSPRGRELWACCPFHNEKTASFHVSPDKQLYHCFGCHAGGGVIQFIMAIERLSYYEAVKYLANRAGMELPNDADDENIRAQRHKRERLHNMCRRAALFYHKQLLESKEGLDYLNKREVSPALIKRFGLGYSPNSWDTLYDELKGCEDKFTDEEIISAGLARRKTPESRPYDFFRNRVMFPIISERGLVLGFGARTMGSDNPKYINTEQTPIFNKRYNLYGLNLQKPGKLSDLIIVEGYMDVISLHSIGVTNVAASLGTSLTREQARLIKRYTQNVYIAYDGDSAGQHATLRGMEILANEGLNVRVIAFPEGLDPDEFARKYGEHGFLDLKDSASLLNSYKIDALSREYDLKNADSRQKFVIDACREIASMQPIERERYYNKLSEMTGYSVKAIEEQADTWGTAGNTFTDFRHNTKNKLPFAQNERSKHELMLAACAAQDTKALKYIVENACDFISNDAVREFIDLLRNREDSESAPDIAQTLSLMTDQDGAKTISAAINEQEISKPLEQALECARGLKRICCREELLTLAKELEDGKVEPDEYMRRYNELNAKLKELDGA